MAIDRADLHSHTTASDGLLTPQEVVRLAHATGLAVVAITDHDTTAGVEAALAEGSRLGIEVVPGVEISTTVRGKDIHILGYYPDWKNTVWQERLGQLREGRAARNEQIIAKLNQLGISISLQEVVESAQKTGIDESVGRPHIAGVLVNKGVVATIGQAFDTLLGTGCPAFVSVPKVSPGEAMTWIREAGGAAVIAHPGLYGDDELVEQLIQEGPVGLEVYHSDHSPEDEHRYESMARRYGLIETGGSDFHGERHGEVFHGKLGNRTVALAVVEQLRSRAIKI
ncbi:PHP domain-containing protein [Paenibacillaceae bacterium]|nr:PHP domain-containing protein [Paenibacillaceae bacterium]